MHFQSPLTDEMSQNWLFFFLGKAFFSDRAREPARKQARSFILSGRMRFSRRLPALSRSSMINTNNKYFLFTTNFRCRFVTFAFSGGGLKISWSLVFKRESLGPYTRLNHMVNFKKSDHHFPIGKRRHQQYFDYHFSKIKNKVRTSLFSIKLQWFDPYFAF